MGTVHIANAGRVMFYGWILVGVAFLNQFVSMGTVFYAYGVLFKPLAEELGGSRLEISLALPLVMIGNALISPFIGRLVDRGRIRGVVIAGALLNSVGLLALSRVNSLWQLDLVYALPLALGVAMLGNIPCSALVANWFVKRRGTALGIAQVGTSLSGVLMVLLVSTLVDELGWRAATGWLALAPVVLLIPTAALLIVARPEQMGLRPDGLPESETATASADSAPRWTLARATRERSVWLIALLIGLNYPPQGAVIQQMYAHATDEGLGAGDAARVISAMAAMAALGKALFGWLGDRMDRRAIAWLCVGVQMLGLASILAASSPLGLGVAAACYGLGYGGVSPLYGLLVGAIYGRRAFGRIAGATAALMLPFQLVGAPFAGWSFDRTGSYDLAFGVFLGLYALAAGVVFLLRLPDVEPDSA